MHLFRFLIILSAILWMVSCKKTKEEARVTSHDSNILPNNPTGSQLADYLAPLTIEDREKIILEQCEKGNTPAFLETFQSVSINQRTASVENTLIIFVSPDYHALGTDNDYIYIPIRPGLAQRIADLRDCSLPTKKIVDEIHRSAPVKLKPFPLIPDESMTTFPIFYQHSNIIRKQRDSLISEYPPGTLIAGNKKDVVITNSLDSETILHKVAIYGWHNPNGIPIQPLYSGHSRNWVDYSHGVRLISNKVILNGDTVRLQSILKDTVLSSLVSDEGVLKILRYP